MCGARFSQALGRATRGSDPGHTNPGAAYATNAGQSPNAVRGARSTTGQDATVGQERPAARAVRRG